MRKSQTPCRSVLWVSTPTITFRACPYWVTAHPFGEALGRAWLAFGITTVRSAASTPYEAVEDREANEAGVRPGPRIYGTGYLMEWMRNFHKMSVVISSPAHLEMELQRAIRSTNRGSSADTRAELLTNQGNPEAAAQLHLGLPQLADNLFRAVPLGRHPASSFRPRSSRWTWTGLRGAGYARALGMTSENETKAIEAAALLHDMGKLAIPEHILNKPGKLTTAEFDKMKRHAAIGAEILSAIDFPYPVVPIVRHHHEQWDGRGYPDGIAGTDIPLGARVLSVVDCFDALTSDRPYRPKLPNSEALQILRDRSGWMYDPRVVGTFIRVHESIAPTEEDLAGRKAIGAIIASELDPDSIQEVAESGVGPENNELQLLNELVGALELASGVQEVCDTISRHLMRLMPSTLCVFYLYDGDNDELVARHATGASFEKAVGLRIPLGHALSGWVGSNRSTIRNSDPILDFGDMIGEFTPPLKAVSVVPSLPRPI